MYDSNYTYLKKVCDDIIDNEQETAVWIARCIFYFLTRFGIVYFSIASIYYCFHMIYLCRFMFKCLDDFFFLFSENMVWAWVNVVHLYVWKTYFYCNWFESVLVSSQEVSFKISFNFLALTIFRLFNYWKFYIIQDKTFDTKISVLKFKDCANFKYYVYIPLSVKRCLFSSPIWLFVCKCMKLANILIQKLKNGIGFSFLNKGRGYYKNSVNVDILSLMVIMRQQWLTSQDVILLLKNEKLFYS